MLRNKRKVFLFALQDSSRWLRSLASGWKNTIMHVNRSHLEKRFEEISDELQSKKETIYTKEDDELYQIKRELLSCTHGKPLHSSNYGQI